MNFTIYAYGCRSKVNLHFNGNKILRRGELVSNKHSATGDDDGYVSTVSLSQLLVFRRLTFYLI